MPPRLSRFHSMKFMATLILIVLFSAFFAPNRTLSDGLSFSIENPEDVLTSPNGEFSAGFYPVGENAYCFAIWFASRPSRSQDPTIVWMANRDHPVNGRKSKLYLLSTGNLILTDAGKYTVWETKTISLSSLELHLYDTGNLVLRTLRGENLWESFDFPTDTLLPQQLLTRNTKLASSRSQTNTSAGFYKLLFDNDNVLCLLYNGTEVSSIYWPVPWLMRNQAGRYVYNSSRIAALDSYGSFRSSDNFKFSSTDYGQLLHRRLTLDYDGNLRLYSWNQEGEMWVVSWQAFQRPCMIPGLCGANSICRYSPGVGRNCSCLQGYKMINHTDWSQGCELELDPTFGENKSGFLELSHVDFYGYDYNKLPDNYTLDECKKSCLELDECKAIQYAYVTAGFFRCYLKIQLMIGYSSPALEGSLYLRVPESNLLKPNLAEEIGLNCSSEGPLLLERVYLKRRQNETGKAMVWFVCGLGGLEIVGILLVWSLFIRIPKSSTADKQGYLPAITGFRKFTYSELKKATKGFTKEIGRGAGGIVYKGVLADSRLAAIKQLYEANKGEDVFLAEVSIIGRLNHMNLIEMWGYCFEGKHRLLVSKYMEHGSLADNLSSNSLDWKKRFEIALGTAKGLSYLHEECLEWVLHCDVKPENIFLDSNYQPKVADFGLSKLQSRGESDNLISFSRMRGTRGYMAPEWVYNLPITSKVDVYSYGIVVLEMVTGKDATKGVHAIDREEQPKRLFSWVREKKNSAVSIESWLEEIIDPRLKGKYDVGKMETLIGVALQCAEEEKNARPSMRQVVEMLLAHENDKKEAGCR